MLPIIQSGSQLRVNGNHKFQEGKHKEALMMYLQVSQRGQASPSRTCEDKGEGERGVDERSVGWWLST